MKKLLIFCLPALALGSQAALGDATVTYSTPEGQANAGAPSQALIADGRVLVKNAGDNNTDLIFEPSNSTMYVIDHAQRQYMKFDEATIDSMQKQVSGMMSMARAQLENMPPEQRAQMEKMMSNMGINIAPQERPESHLESAGDKQYSGFECGEMHVMEGEEKVATICVSKGNNLGLDDADYTTLMGMQRFTFELATKARDLVGQIGASVPNLAEDTTLGGVIIQGSDDSNAATPSMNIASIENGDLPDDATALPAGYTEGVIPSLEEMMR